MNHKDDRTNRNIGDEIIEGLTEFRDTLRDGEHIAKKFTMRQVQLELEPHEFTAEDVRDMRDIFRASQAVFAKMIGVSPSTLQNWEQGRTPPPPWARRMLELMQSDPEPWKKMLYDSTVTGDCDNNCSRA